MAPTVVYIPGDKQITANITFESDFTNLNYKESTVTLYSSTKKDWIIKNVPFNVPQQGSSTGENLTVSMVIKDLENAAIYPIKVTALDISNNETSTSLTNIVPAGVPSAPMNIRSVAIDNTSFDILIGPYSNNGAKVTKAIVDIIDTTSLIIVSSTNIDKTNIENGVISVTDLEPQHTYEVAIRLGNTTGFGLSSPSILAIASSIPSAPELYNQDILVGDSFSTMQLKKPSQLEILGCSALAVKSYLAGESSIAKWEYYKLNNDGTTTKQLGATLADAKAFTLFPFDKTKAEFITIHLSNLTNNVNTNVELAWVNPLNLGTACSQITTQAKANPSSLIDFKLTSSSENAYTLAATTPSENWSSPQYGYFLVNTIINPYDQALYNAVEAYKGDANRTEEEQLYTFNDYVQTLKTQIGMFTDLWDYYNNSSMLNGNNSTAASRASIIKYYSFIYNKSVVIDLQNVLYSELNSKYLKNSASFSSGVYDSSTAWASSAFETAAKAIYTIVNTKYDLSNNQSLISLLTNINSSLVFPTTFTNSILLTVANPSEANYASSINTLITGNTPNNFALYIASYYKTVNDFKSTFLTYAVTNDLDITTSTTNGYKALTSINLLLTNIQKLATRYIPILTSGVGYTFSMTAVILNAVPETSTGDYVASPVSTITTVASKNLANIAKEFKSTADSGNLTLDNSTGNNDVVFKFTNSNATSNSFKQLVVAGITDLAITFSLPKQPYSYKLTRHPAFSTLFVTELPKDLSLKSVVNGVLPATNGLSVEIDFSYNTQFYQSNIITPIAATAVLYPIYATPSTKIPQTPSYSNGKINMNLIPYFSTESLQGTTLKSIAGMIFTKSDLSTYWSTYFPNNTEAVTSLQTVAQLISSLSMQKQRDLATSLYGSGNFTTYGQANVKFNLQQIPGTTFSTSSLTLNKAGVPILSGNAASSMALGFNLNSINNPTVEIPLNSTNGTEYLGFVFQISSIADSNGSIINFIGGINFMQNIIASSTVPTLQSTPVVTASNRQIDVDILYSSIITSDGEAPISHVRLYLVDTLGNEVPEKSYTIAVPTDTTNFRLVTKFTDLNNGTGYQLKIKAMNKNGWSAAITSAESIPYGGMQVFIKAYPTVANPKTAYTGIINVSIFKNGNTVSKVFLIGDISGGPILDTSYSTTNKPSTYDVSLSSNSTDLTHGMIVLVISTTGEVAQGQIVLE
jgi:hypothetical protein